MARLILMFNNQVVKEYPLMKESITIGRNEDNTITVDNLAVSGYHARIDAAGKDFILTDLQSTNGTFVNDKKVISHKLVHGDNVIVGKHLILFVGEGKEAPSIKSGDNKLDMDKTMMLDTAKQKELLAKQAGTAATAVSAQKLGVISFIEGADLGEVELTKKTYQNWQGRYIGNKAFGSLYAGYCSHDQQKTFRLCNYINGRKIKG